MNLLHARHTRLKQLQMLPKLTLLVFAILLCASLAPNQYSDTQQMSLLSCTDDNLSLQIVNEHFRNCQGGVDVVLRC